MGWLKYLWRTVAGINPPAYTEMSLEAHCQTVKPWLVAELRKMSRYRNNPACNHRTLINVDNLLPDNLTLKSLTLGDAGNVVIVVADFMRRGELFAIMVSTASGNIVVQRAHRTGGAATGGSTPGQDG